MKRLIYKKKKFQASAAKYDDSGYETNAVDGWKLEILNPKRYKKGSWLMNMSRSNGNGPLWAPWLGG